MKGDGGTALIWGASSVVAAVAVVLAVVTGDWFAVVGWLVAVAGSVGAAGQSARLYRLHRDIWDWEGGGFPWDH